MNEGGKRVAEYHECGQCGRKILVAVHSQEGNSRDATKQSLPWPLSEYAERLKGRMLPDAWPALYALVAYAEELTEAIRSPSADECNSITQAAGESAPADAVMADLGGMESSRAGERPAPIAPSSTAVDSDAAAKALYETNAKGWRNAPPWGELHEDTRQLWRDEAAKRAPSASGEVEALRAALAEIAKGEGAFNRDPLQHASNCIESMKRIASNALTSTKASVK